MLENVVKNARLDEALSHAISVDEVKHTSRARNLWARSEKDGRGGRQYRVCFFQPLRCCECQGFRVQKPLAEWLWRSCRGAWHNSRCHIAII